MPPPVEHESYDVLGPPIRPAVRIALLFVQMGDQLLLPNAQLRSDTLRIERGAS